MHSSGCCDLETNSPFHLKITGISASAQDVSVSRLFHEKIQWDAHLFLPPFGSDQTEKAR